MLRVSFSARPATNNGGNFRRETRAAKNILFDLATALLKLFSRDFPGLSRNIFCVLLFRPGNAPVINTGCLELLSAHQGHLSHILEFIDFASKKQRKNGVLSNHKLRIAAFAAGFAENRRTAKKNAAFWGAE